MNDFVVPALDEPETVNEEMLKAMFDGMKSKIVNKVATMRMAIPKGHPNRLASSSHVAKFLSEHMVGRMATMRFGTALIVPSAQPSVTLAAARSYEGSIACMASVFHMFESKGISAHAFKPCVNYMHNSVTNAVYGTHFDIDLLTSVLQMNTMVRGKWNVYSKFHGRCVVFNFTLNGEKRRGVALVFGNGSIVLPNSVSKAVSDQILEKLGRYLVRFAIPKRSGAARKRGRKTK